MCSTDAQQEKLMSASCIFSVLKRQMAFYQQASLVSEGSWWRGESLSVKPLVIEEPFGVVSASIGLEVGVA